MASLITGNVEQLSGDPGEQAEHLLSVSDASLPNLTLGQQLQLVAIPEATGPVQILDLSNPQAPGIKLLLVVPVSP